MDQFLLHNEDWQRLYHNCTSINSTPLPWPQRRHVLESYVLIAIGAIYYVLYLPCTYSFWKNRRDEKGLNACYQMMFYISVVDMGVLWIPCFYCSYQFLSGTVYCSNPLLHYFIGKIAQSLVFAEIASDVVLALNRCVDILSPSFASILFRGKRTWIWLGACTLNGLYALLLNQPLVYNGLTLAFASNPYLGFWNDEVKFHNPVHMSINEAIMAFSTPVIYILFFLAFLLKSSAYGFSNVATSKMQRSVFFQVLLISIFNMAAGTLYYLKEVFPGIISPQFIFLAQFSWVQVHGVPPVIYLLFNKTVRRDIRKLFNKFFKTNRIGQGVSATVTQYQSKNTQTATNFNAIKRY